MTKYTADELQTVLCARFLLDQDVCFVTDDTSPWVYHLARLHHAPNLSVIHESGLLGLAGNTGGHALPHTTVAMPEMFQYWLQGGWATAGFLRASQLDRYANVNTTVMGDYAAPKRRLPGSGSGPEMAAHCGRICVLVEHSPRTLVPRVDFVSALGFGPDGRSRERLGLNTAGPVQVITELCILRPHPETHELVVTSLHPGVTRMEVQTAAGWTLGFANTLSETPSPTDDELRLLRQLRAGPSRDGFTNGSRPRVTHMLSDLSDKASGY